MKKNFTEIEEIIESRIAELEKEYDLDRYDIGDIRLKAYRENGWSCDPFPLDEEEEEEPEEKWRYRSIGEQLAVRVLRLRHRTKLYQSEYFLVSARPFLCKKRISPHDHGTDCRQRQKNRRKHENGNETYRQIIKSFEKRFIKPNGQGYPHRKTNKNNQQNAPPCTE